MSNLSDQTRFFIKQTYTFSLIAVALKYLPPAIIYPRGTPAADDISDILAAMSLLSGIVALACLPSVARDLIRQRQADLFESISEAKKANARTDLSRRVIVPEEKRLLFLRPFYIFSDRVATIFEIGVPIGLGFTIFFLNFSEVYDLIASTFGGD